MHDPDTSGAYTVIGLIEEASGELLIAGVVKGDHVPTDGGEYATEGYDRWADSFFASDPNHAMKQAINQWEAGYHD